MSDAPRESSQDPAARLEAALAELQRDLRAKQPVHRYHARALLVPLGELILAGEEAAARETDGGPRNGAPAGEDLAEAWTARVREAVTPLEERWTAAASEELALACAEHVQGVDPRFLDHPGYDFVYTVRARERLEARLRACGALDVELPEGLLARVAEADARLAPYLTDGLADGA